MVTKNSQHATFYQCLKVSWGLIALVLLTAISGILRFFDVRFIVFLAIPLGLIAMCLSLFAVLQSGEVVELEKKEGRHH